MTPPNSHDPFIRRFLSNRQESIDYFKKTLPTKVQEHMDLENLELIKESFIGKTHEESRTDLLYKIPLRMGNSAFIYLLFEHKSYYDPKIYTQLLDYLSKIYQWQDENNIEKSIVIPFVFYHGKQKWDLGSSFLDSFSSLKIPKELKKYIPNFKIELFNLRPNGKEFQTENLSLNLYIRLIQIIRYNKREFKSEFQKLIHKLFTETDNTKKIEIFEEIVQYLFRAREDAEEYTSKTIFKEMEKEYMNLLERLEEKGRLEGLQEGLQEGEFRTKLETAQKMREFGDSLEKIITITGLSESQLKENGIV
jgi:predicted transposase/invertase (TIGR01784 family)